MPERRYPAERVVVRYDPTRCIHFAACVRGLPGVFDKDRRPWIDPTLAPPEAVAEVVVRCPTGALHYTPAGPDGAAAGPPEAVPDANTVAVDPDGPLFVHGDVTVEAPDGTVLLRDTRVAFCRCGRSQHKPFCDNSHLAGFADPAALGTHNATAPEAGGGPLRVILAENGPLMLRGPVEIEGAGGACVATAKASLCRCGASKNKPFCDGSHRQIGFTTAAAPPGPAPSAPPGPAPA